MDGKKARTRKWQSQRDLILCLWNKRPKTTDERKWEKTRKEKNNFLNLGYQKLFKHVHSLCIRAHQTRQLSSTIYCQQYNPFFYHFLWCWRWWGCMSHTQLSHICCNKRNEFEQLGSLTDAMFWSYLGAQGTSEKQKNKRKRGRSSSRIKLGATRYVFAFMIYIICIFLFVAEAIIFNLLYVGEQEIFLFIISSQNITSNIFSSVHYTAVSHQFNLLLWLYFHFARLLLLRFILFWHLCESERNQTEEYNLHEQTNTSLF